MKKELERDLLQIDGGDEILHRLYEDINRRSWLKKFHEDGCSLGTATILWTASLGMGIGFEAIIHSDKFSEYAEVVKSYFGG